MNIGSGLVNSQIEATQLTRRRSVLREHPLTRGPHGAMACWPAVLCVTIPLLSGCGGFETDRGVFPLPTIHLVAPPPFQFGLDWEDIRLTAENGQTLYAWFIPAEQARATVLIHHGAVVNRSSTHAHYLLFHELGCHVFVYDYQGFGESLQLASLDTILSDADTALAYVQSRGREVAGPIILYGASMGTLPTFAQGARSPEGVAGIIIEGCFVPQELPPLAFCALGITPSPEAFLRIPDNLNPTLNAPRVALPKLFLQSRADDVTPLPGAEELFDVAVEPKTFQEVRGGHIEAVHVDAGYRGCLSEFLDALLGPAGP